MAADPGGGGTPPRVFGSRFEMLANEQDNVERGVSSKKFKNVKRTAQRDRENEQIFSKQLRLYGKDNGGRFLILTRTDEGKTMDDVNPFLIKKCIDNITSGVEITRFKDGKLLLKSTDRHQAEKLCKQKSLCDSIHVNIVEHDSLNRTKGTIYCPDLKPMKDEDIQKHLAEFHVVEVRRMQRISRRVTSTTTPPSPPPVSDQPKENEKKTKPNLEDTGSFILTFDLSYLPDTIDVGFYKCKLRLYVPNPMRCNVCLRYGHKKESCKGNRVCAKCAELFHDQQPCLHPVKCVNCRGSHMAFSKECPIYVDEQEIQKIRVTQRVTMKEARQKRRQQVPLELIITQRPSQTFAGVLRTGSNGSISPTQTQTSPVENPTKALASSKPTTLTRTSNVTRATQHENTEQPTPNPANWVPPGMQNENHEKRCNIKNQSDSDLNDVTSVNFENVDPPQVSELSILSQAISSSILLNVPDYTKINDQDI